MTFAFTLLVSAALAGPALHDAGPVGWKQALPVPAGWQGALARTPQTWGRRLVTPPAPPRPHPYGWSRPAHPRHVEKGGGYDGQRPQYHRPPPWPGPPLAKRKTLRPPERHRPVIPAPPNFD